MMFLSSNVSARFEKVKTNSEKIWRYIRYSYIMDYRMRIPAVLNIVMRPLMVLYWCVSRKSTCCECKGKNESKFKSKTEKKS